jgi:hypothetical protein
MQPLDAQSITPQWKWSSEKMWSLDIPTTVMNISDLTWQFAYPIWDREGTDDWNLTPMEYIANPEAEPSHHAKVQTADLHFPIHVLWYNDQYRVLDGMHRLVKAYMRGDSTIQVKIIPQSFIPLIRM